METQHKHGNKEKLSSNSFLLFTCKLVIWNMCFRDQSVNNKKSSSLYLHKRSPLYVTSRRPAQNIPEDIFSPPYTLSCLHTPDGITGTLKYV